MSENESLTADSEDDASTVTTQAGDSETEEEDVDPWMPMAYSGRSNIRA